MEGLSLALQNEGWHLKKSAIETLKGPKRNYHEIKTKAINCDLCEIGEKYIQEQIASSEDGVLVGPCVLQVSKIRNVSAPKDNEYSSVAPRMLKLSLTDGSNTVTAIEYEPLSDISLKTPPGSKVQLVGSIVTSQGSLNLTRSCIKVLGGKVEKLYTKWKIAQDMNAISRMDVQSDSGPPPFVAFGKRTVGTKQFDKSVKSLQNITKDEENENTDFTAQRKAAIANVAQISNGKKVLLHDARARFGKMPVGEIKAKPRNAYERNKQHVEETEKRSTESQKSVRMYRELSTESGNAVHQKTVNEFVSMGFKYEDVVFCLRKANNDFELAMDLLTALPENNPTNQHSDNHIARGRSNKSRGRGRRRGGSNSHLDHADEEQSSSPATLMDFIDNRMSNMLIPSKSEQQVPQENAKTTRYDNRNTREPHRGNHRGRGRGHNRGGYKRDGYNRHEDHQEEQNQRNNNRSQYRYSATDNATKDNFKHPQNRTHHHSNPGRQQENGPQQQQQRYSSQRSGPSHTGEKVFEKQGSSHNNGSKRKNSPTDFEHRKHYQNQGTKAEVRHNPSHEYSKRGAKNDKSNAFNHVPLNPPPQHGPTTYAFSGVPLNPPPQRGPTTFGNPNYEGEIHHANATSYNHPSFTPSFQQENARSTQRLHVTIPQWQVGSHCLAKYWEDSEYYHAIITDVHPEAPTAVVQFADFGNYEEVKMFDLKPIVTPPTETTITGASNQFYPDASMSHQDYRQERHVKPPMALYVHPKHRGNQ